MRRARMFCSGWPRLAERPPDVLDDLVRVGASIGDRPLLLPTDEAGVLFVDDNAPVPAGDPQPRGDIMTLVCSAGTLRVTDFGLRMSSHQRLSTTGRGVATALPVNR